MRKIIIGIILGVVAGVIDVIPMILQKLPVNADLSAFSLWIISGFIISTNELKINSILKGLIISFLILIPCTFIIGWNQPISLIPISIMTLILGSLLGFTIHIFGKAR